MTNILNRMNGLQAGWVGAACPVLQIFFDDSFKGAPREVDLQKSIITFL